MRKLIVTAWITLDGVFDAQSMDQWHAPYHSDSRARCIIEDILGCDAILFGRHTYEMLASYWPSLKNNEFGVADKLNSVAKYVVSTTLKKKAGWNNSTVIRENVVATINQLKQQAGNYILVEGSATLVHTLMEAGCIDEYRFLVNPVIMGSGKRFFQEGNAFSKLQLVKSQPLDLGVIQLVYMPVK